MSLETPVSPPPPSLGGQGPLVRILQNQEPTSAPRQVVVNNYTPQYVDLWVNGSYMTQVLPGAGQVVTLQQRWNPTVLTAYGNDDSSTWGPRYI
jgi:hypothetical protein